MKAFLMYRDRDLDLEVEPPPTAAAVTQDLELGRLYNAMAAGDRFLFEVARAVVPASLLDPDEIRYRQGVLADCLQHPTVVVELYGIAVGAIEGERRLWGGSGSRLPESLLHRSVDVLVIFFDALKRMRQIADEAGPGFQSEGFTRFFGMIATELDDAYLQTVEDHLERLRFRDGIVMSARFGTGNRGVQYVLRKPRDARLSWRERLAFWDRSGLVYTVPDRDDAGFAALAELNGRGVGLVAAALAQSTDHILDFFRLVRAELGFYVGCLNLHQRLIAKGEPVCFPEPTPLGVPALSVRGLYDVCLSLIIPERVVGNDVDADDRLLLVITGANRGGKSTFLRSAGLAQLMMQAGMFVAAQSFRADVRQDLATHFKREEDASLQSGKLAEELGRMSAIVDTLTPDSVVLLNESFASTNEREGSEIARQIVRALIERGIKVLYVTHLHDLAHAFYREGMAEAAFLRAERLPDGRRTFRLVEGEPLPTSFGEDVYRQVFGGDIGAVPPEPQDEVA
ncbi:MAG: MutS-related protein [Candidatus Limnocylindrales bacterium]